MARLFQLQENCLRLMGHNLVGSGEAGPSLGLRHIASLLFVLSAEYPMLSYVIHNRDDMELITACLSVAFTNLVTVTKIWTFLAYKRNFARMAQSFRQLDAKSPHEADSYLGRANKQAISLGRSYCISCGFTGLYFMLGPIVKIVSNRWRGLPYTRELPMPMKFPFNDVDSPGYECGFIYTIFVTIFVVLYASAVDGLFVSFAIHLRAHFQTLQQDMRQLSFSQPEEEEEELVQQQLAEIVDYHVLLLSLSRQLRRIYAPIVFGQFFLTSLEVGVIIYQIVTHMDSVMNLLVYFSFFGSIMLQLLIYCYGGEMIKIESLQVGVAIQTSDWHVATPKQRRTLVFIMQRAQKEMLIKAGFYEASLANFVAILRAAMSFITLIQSIE